MADLIRSGSTTDFTPEEIQRFASLIAKPGSMFALDDTEAGRQSRRDTSFATNVLLVRSPTTYTGSDDSLRAEAASQIEQQVSSTSAATSRARRQDGAMLGSQPATTLEYDLKVNGTPVIEVDYVTARDGVLYQSRAPPRRTGTRTSGGCATRWPPRSASPADAGRLELPDDLPRIGDDADVGMVEDPRGPRSVLTATTVALLCIPSQMRDGAGDAEGQVESRLHRLGAAPTSRPVGARRLDLGPGTANRPP